MLYFSVLYFSCCIFRGIFLPVVLKSFHSLRRIILLHVCHIFGQTLKAKVSLRVGQLELIHSLVICPCLFQTYLILRNFNFMLLFLIISLIFSLREWRCWIRFSIAFHFRRHFIIKVICLSFIPFIIHHLFWINRINKLDGVGDFASEIGYTSECNGVLCCNATEILPVLLI